MAERSNRQLNIELLRIFAAIGVVLLHIKHDLKEMAEQTVHCCQ